MFLQILAVLAGAAIAAAPLLIFRNGRLSPWHWHAALALGALALAAGGVRFDFFNRVWLNIALTAAWVVSAGGALGRAGEPRSLGAGLAAVAALAYFGLALLHGQVLAGWLAGGALALSLVWLARARAGQRSAVDIAGRWVVGFSVAAAGIELSFPGRSPLSTPLIPAVVLGIPLADLALSLAGRVRALLQRDGAASARPGSLSAWFVRAGWSERQASILLWGAGLLLGAAALAMSVLEPFLANALAFLAALACLGAFRARQIARLGRLPLLIYALGGATLLAFIFSLRYNFLDFIFVGALVGYQGLDFFQIPCAFYYFQNGITLYGGREVPCPYAPWDTTFQLHPLAALMPGAFFYALPPWAAYTTMVAFSLGVALGLSWLFARLMPDALRRSLVFLFLAASWPFYLVLWMGQSQIFVLLSFGLIAYALLLHQEGWSRRASAILGAGLLAGLLTKPLMAPVALPLLAARETRRVTALALLVYVALSIPMIVVPGLNPGATPVSAFLEGRMPFEDYRRESGNLRHWTYLVRFDPGRNMGIERQVFSPVELIPIARLREVAGPWLRLAGGLAVLFQVWAVAAARTSAARLQQLRLAAVLSALLYIVFYSQVFEHHYATLAVAPVVLLWMLLRTSDRRARLYLIAGLLAYAPYLLPSIFPWVMPDAPREDYYSLTPLQIIPYRLFRALPAVLLFLAAVFAMLRFWRLDRGAAPAGEPSPGSA